MVSVIKGKAREKFKGKSFNITFTNGGKTRKSISKNYLTKFEYIPTDFKI